MKNGKLKLLYACSEIPAKSFTCMVPDSSTCEDVLQLISKKQKADYIALFDDGSQIDNDEDFKDYWEADKIFYASTTPTPPTAKFINTVRAAKEGTSTSTATLPKAEPKSTKDDHDTEPEKKTPVGAPKVGPPKVGIPKVGAPKVGVPKVGAPKINPPKPTPTPGEKSSGGPVKLPAALKNKTPAFGTHDDTGKYTPSNINANTDIQASTCGNNPHNYGVDTKTTVERKDVAGKYIFYFTGSNKDHLMDGIEVELDTAMNPNAARARLLEALKDAKVNMNGKQLIIYLPGGIPFIAGTLGDLFLSDNMKNAKHRIYGVITRPIPDSILNKSCLQICNVSDADHKLLISPLCNSSERGLSDMACLLGYLNNYGLKGDLLLKTCAATIHFPPLLTSLNRIIERNQVVWRDVVTVCSTLFTYFRIYLPKTIADDKVFEYALRMCNLISHIGDIPDKIPMMQIEVKPSDSGTQFLQDLKLGPIVYFWRRDTGEDFSFVDLDLQGVEAIENAYNSIVSFTPIAPLSMRSAAGCSIVRGKKHEYLYLMQSASKDAKSQNKVDMIDPLTGLNEPKDVESFAQEQGNTKADTTANLIDPESVKQIIMVNFDESGSMIGDLGGYVIEKNSQKDHRVTIGIQYLTAFANRTYGYRIPCIQGLISFNNQIKVRCSLSPLVPDFEDNGLKNIKPEATTKLWDSLIRGCEEIVKFRKDSKGNEIFKNAKSRILVISDGEDYKSKAKVEDVVKELVKNKIIVDSVIISTEDECKMLCAVCHATGGLAFRPETVSEGLSLFEQSAFLNVEERKSSPDPLIPGDRKTTANKLAANPDLITEELMNKAKEHANFDKDVPNKELIQASANVRVATPRHVCAKNVNAQIPTPRQRRILRELHAAAETNDPSIASRYDPDMKIYTFQANLDRWKVFLKGPVGTPYENKWWYLYVTFPELYPVQPPIFRFVSIPYHLNVSSEGRICLNNIEKGYISSKNVVDIIQEIKELFLIPSLDTPVQIETYYMFKNNPTQYEKLARESTKNNAKDNIDDYISPALVVNEVPKEFKLDFDPDEHVPPYMRSQISGKKLDKNKMVMASSGVYYDKDELRQLVASNKNPVCVITGKVLTERPEDLADPDDPDAI